MIDVVFIFESLKRRWYVVLAALLLVGAFGAVSTTRVSSEATLAPTYRAEATLYVYGAFTIHETEGMDKLVNNDARRVVLSDSVAGETRRVFGKEVEISAPLWTDPETSKVADTRFVFIEATAPSQETALEAANYACNLAVALLQENSDFETVYVYEPAIVKTTAEGAANYGTGALEPSTATAIASTFDLKRELVFIIAGFCLGCVLALLWDYLRRRIRSAHDIDRMLGVQVVATVGKNNKEKGFNQAAITVASLSTRKNMGTVAVCGFAEADTALVETLVEDINSVKQGIQAVAIGNLSDVDERLTQLVQADCAVLVTQGGAASAKNLAASVEKLRLLDTAILGAVFVE